MTNPTQKSLIVTGDPKETSLIRPEPSILARFVQPIGDAIKHFEATHPTMYQVICAILFFTAVGFLAAFFLVPMAYGPVTRRNSESSGDVMALEHSSTSTNEFSPQLTQSLTLSAVAQSLSAPQMGEGASLSGVSTDPTSEPSRALTTTYQQPPLQSAASKALPITSGQEVKAPNKASPVREVDVITVDDQPSLADIKTLLNERPNAYLVDAPADLSIPLLSPLFNFSAIFNSMIIPAYPFNTIAATTNFSSLYFLPGSMVQGGNWQDVYTSNSYFPHLWFNGTLASVVADSSYAPGLRVSDSPPINGLWVRHGDISDAILSGLMLRNFLVDGTQMSGADLSGTEFRGSSFYNTNMTGSNLTGTSFIADPDRFGLDATFFSVANASGSLVCDTLFNQTQGWNGGIDKGLDLASLRFCPNYHVYTLAIVNSAGLHLSLNNNALPATQIVDNLFYNLDLRGVSAEPGTTITHNTVDSGSNPVTEIFTFFEGTHLPASQVIDNDFGYVLCGNGDCPSPSIPLPPTCLNTTAAFYQANQIKPDCLPIPSSTSPTTGTSTGPDTSTHTITKPTHTTTTSSNYTRPQDEHLSSLDIGFIAGGGLFAAVTLFGVGYALHKKGMCPSLEQNQYTPINDPDDTSIQGTDDPSQSSMLACC